MHAGVRRKHPSLIGVRFGRLTVEEDLGMFVVARCDCGGRKVARWTSLREGWTQSCGCKRGRLQGEAKMRRHRSRKASRYSEATMARIIELRNQGWTHEAIGVELSVTTTSVQKWLQAGRGGYVYEGHNRPRRSA
jgi:hypothetical protein